MFVKQIKKKNKASDKEYIYYRLVHTYKIGKKTRHQNILGLGKLENLTREKHKALADRIEELVTGKSNSLFAEATRVAEVEKLAQQFAAKIIKEKLFATGNKTSISKDLKVDYQEVDMESMEQEQSKDIGGEWLVKQAFNKLNISGILKDSGLSENQVEVAQMLLTAKLIHPSSELETERWLDENSAASELYNLDKKVTRYKLYQAAEKMYESKDIIDTKIYNEVKTIFSNRNKIVIYDLTNMYFEGQMLDSKKAEFGRSKQKQSGSKLIGLALAIDSMGFVRYNKFYKGNISEPGTFEDMLKEVVGQLGGKGEKPVIVMDAGIAIEANLKLIRSEPYEYDYVCVSRILPRNYSKLSDKGQSITDNRGNKIELTKIDVADKEDNFLHVKSSQKLKKEESMDLKLSKNFEEQLQEIKDKLPKKRTLKKAEKVHEKVGNLKGRFSRVGFLYDIKYTEENGIVKDITWKRKKEKEKPKGEYFLRYTQNAISESNIWDVYNLTRDVESVFRCLKTDLDIRPIYHQKDKYIEPHIWLGILAYQVVNYIRTVLKENGINYSWSTIVEKMRPMQSSIVSVNNSNDQKIFVKLCTRPSKGQQEIFDCLKFKHRPYVRKTKVVPQL